MYYSIYCRVGGFLRQLKEFLENGFPQSSLLLVSAKNLPTLMWEHTVSSTVPHRLAICMANFLILVSAQPTLMWGPTVSSTS